MVNVPKDFQDYDDDDELAPRRKTRWKYWSNLQAMLKEFDAEKGYTETTDVFQWIENKYGLRPVRASDGTITDDYKVVDEKKFLVYILKYGQ